MTGDRGAIRSDWRRGRCHAALARPGGAGGVGWVERSRGSVGSSVTVLVLNRAWPREGRVERGSVSAERGSVSAGRSGAAGGSSRVSCTWWRLGTVDGGERCGAVVVLPRWSY